MLAVFASTEVVATEASIPSELFEWANEKLNAICFVVFRASFPRLHVATVPESEQR